MGKNGERLSYLTAKFCGEVLSCPAFCATDTNTTRYTTQFKDEERRLVHRRDKNRKTESALRQPFANECRHVVVSASRNRRRRKETERRSNSEVPPSNKSAPDESKHNTVSKGADEPFTSYNSLYKFDSFSKERSSVEIIEKDTFRTEAEGVFFSSLNTLLSVDYLLLFGVDGVLPEIINGRCAMIGLLLGFANEVMTKKSLNEQLVFNVTHGVTPLIAIMVILFSLVPSFLINQDKHMVEPGSQNVRNPQGWFGQGAFRYKFDERFRGRRAYAVDPAVSDWKIFQMKTPLGHIGCVPFAEVVNARFAMFVLAGTFFIEGFLGHGILSS